MEVETYGIMKRIVAITGYRSDYTKLKSVLEEIDNHPNLELKIVAFGAHTLDDCGDTFKQIELDGFKIEEMLDTSVQGAGTAAMTKSMGMALIELPAVLQRLNPDASLIVGDRYEIMSAALASSVNNIPVIHIQGGEISGTIDEVLRHSITKLSHLHFPSTKKSAQRIIRMGEDPDLVFNVGCPAIDYIFKQEYLSTSQMNKAVKDYGHLKIDFEKDYAIVIQHAVTTEYKNSYLQMKTTLEALQSVGIKSLVIYPNPDTGASSIVRAIRNHGSKYKEKSIICEKAKNLPFNVYLNILKNCKLLVGNSSSGLREAHVFNIPVINIGTRQDGRERTSNIVDVPHDKQKIIEAVKNFDTGNSYIHSENIYGNGTAATQMVDIINSVDFNTLIGKKFYDQ